MNQIDIDVSLLDNPYRFNAADKNYINFNGLGYGKTVRDAIRERHRFDLYSNASGLDLPMAHMLDESLEEKKSNFLVEKSEDSTTSSTISPVKYISKAKLSSGEQYFSTKPKIQLTQSAKENIANLIKSSTSTPKTTTSSEPTKSVDNKVVSAPIVMGGGGGGGGSASSDDSGDSSKIASEKKYLGLTKKQGLIALGIVAFGTLAYFKFVKKAF